MTGLSGFNFMNNLIYAPGNSISDGIAFVPGMNVGHNMWSSAPPSILSGPGDTVTSSPGLASPGYAPTPGNFDTDMIKLQSTSPAIGAGVNIPSITTDYFGTSRPSGAYDIGAYQHTSADSGPTLVVAPPSGGLVTPPNPIRIMPLGDSITLGAEAQPTPINNYAGYRYPLYSQLLASLLSFHFVGSLAQGTNFPEINHEGHGGWTIEMIRESIDSWLDQSKPDLVLLMAGTNDMWQARFRSNNVAVSIAALDDLVREISKHSPGIRVIVAQIPPLDSGAVLLASFGSTLVDPNIDYGAEVDTFNSQIPGIVAKEQADGLNVTMVDMHSALNLATDFDGSGVHPDDAGYIKIANVWYRGIKAVFQLPKP
jgi:lysophospholipase L1-like esterase